MDGPRIVSGQLSNLAYRQPEEIMPSPRKSLAQAQAGPVQLHCRTGLERASGHLHENS